MNGPPAVPSAQDPKLASRLRRMRLFATALLLVMAIVYVGVTWLASPTPYLGEGVSVSVFAPISSSVTSCACGL